MTSQEIVLVQESFAKVAPIADQAADLFYARLFQLDPAFRSMFKGDLREQKNKLMHMLTLAVKGLNKVDELVPAVRHLGRRHTGYEVQAQHYDTVGAALLWTLEQGLGEAFTPATRAAWVTVYTLLADTMQQGGAAPVPAIHALAPATA